MTLRKGGARLHLPSGAGETFMPIQATCLVARGDAGGRVWHILDSNVRGPQTVEVKAIRQTQAER